VAAPLPRVVDWSAYPPEPVGLSRQARGRVDPRRTSYGQEPLGLVLALRARELEARNGAEIPSAPVSEALVLAYWALGRDEDARAAMAVVLEAIEEGQRPESESYFAALSMRMAAARTPEGLRLAEEEIARLERELARAESRLGERRVWRFSEEHSEARWWNSQLTELIDGLEDLRDEATGPLSPEGVSAEHGWSVPRRLRFALDLEAGFAPGGRYARAWERALPAIRGAYPGLELEAQMGLVPLGPDPASGLWEFAHLMTGRPPERREEDGRLELTEQTGLVLVLLPGGTFFMGAQAEDPTGPNYDPQAREWERPPHEVELSPFFVSKYEMSRGQWLRMSGVDPTPDGVRDLLSYPVQSISWSECSTQLARAGLAFPSEARWEYAARAGTSTPWFTGAERRSVAEQRAANLADFEAARQGVDFADVTYYPEPWDGFAHLSPIGHFAANAFGLHDVIGSVYELCQDGFVADYYVTSPRLDPVAPWERSARVFYRGGSWKRNALSARSSFRSDIAKREVDSDVGVRPARELDR
jgi:formylglycine-generating enzyme required for sulfatase activity